MFQRVAVLGIVSLTVMAASACSSSGKISLGDDGKALLAAATVVPVTSECAAEARHPNVCCKGEACYVWIDDPFRPCDPGYETRGDGAKCCSSADPTSCTSPPPPPQPPPPQLQLQPASCITFDGNSVVQVSLDDGKVSKMFDVTGDLNDVSSIALTPQQLLFCRMTPAGVQGISLNGGGAITTVANIPCDAVTADDEAIWVQSMFEQTLKRFPDVGALAANKPSLVLKAPHASRLGPGEGELLAAWHSDSKISRVDRLTGSTTDVTLEGYDGWIFGISAARGGRIVISSPVGLGGEGALISFDAKTGKRLGSSGKPTGPLGFNGLFCEYQGTATKGP